MDADLVNRALHRAIAEQFEWGVDDCCTFVCDIVHEITARDFMEPLRGRYDSEASAAHAMESFSGGGLVRTAIALAKLANLQEKRFPWAGDLIGVVAGNNGPMLGLFFQGAWLVRTLGGTGRLPARQGVIAWRLE